jgi:hypothetical protein
VTAALKTKDLYEGIKKAKGAEYADAIWAKLDASSWRSKAKELAQTGKKAALDFRKEYKNKVATVIVVAPLAASVGYLVGDWLHDKVVERLGKDNFATPYVVPVAGAAIAVVGYTMKGDLDVKAGVTGLGVGMAAAGLKRSYYDFWSKP